MIRNPLFNTSGMAVLVIGASLGVIIFGMAVFEKQKMSDFTQALFIFIGGLFFVVCTGCIIRSCCIERIYTRPHRRSPLGRNIPPPGPIIQGSYGEETAPVIVTINKAGVASATGTAPLPEQDTILYE